MVYPTREEYEKASDEIHLEIGRAITEWSIVEQWLFDIYSRLVAPGAVSMGLSASFNQVYSVDTRLAMMLRLVEHSGMTAALRKKQFEDWKPLANKLKTLSQKRSRIAHGSIISPVLVLEGPPKALPVWVPFYDARGYKLFKLGMDGAPHFHEYTAIDLAAIRMSFLEIQRPLAEFYGVHFPQSGP